MVFAFQKIILTIFHFIIINLLVHLPAVLFVRIGRFFIFNEILTIINKIYLYNIKLYVTFTSELTTIKHRRQRVTAAKESEINSKH